MKFLVPNDVKKKLAHLWRGGGTYCGYPRHPGYRKKKYSVSDDCGDLRICSRCRLNYHMIAGQPLDYEEGTMIITLEEIMALRTGNGGWKRAILELWGVSWPPPRGWKKFIIGKPGPKEHEETRRAYMDEIFGKETA